MSDHLPTLAAFLGGVVVAMALSVLITSALHLHGPMAFLVGMGLGYACVAIAVALEAGIRR